MSKERLRKDAQRNRDAILVAARALYAESSDVSMCEVARRAGVGQATLYRNFPDGRALVAELLTEHVEAVERLSLDYADAPDAFFILLRELVEGVAGLFALGELAREDACLNERLGQARERVGRLLTRPLEDAKATGLVQQDVSMDDVFLVLLMTRGAMARSEGGSARRAVSDRVLTLVLRGLASPLEVH